MGRTLVAFACLACGRTFQARADQVKRGHGKYCSQPCRGKALGLPAGEGSAGEANHNWKGGISRDWTAYKRRFQERNPEKAAAHEAVRQAVRSGRLIRKPCEICGARAEGHHEDYSRPLDVRWLCRLHHMATHGRVSA